MSAPPLPLYYIADGVHRSVAARENGLRSVVARLVVQGQADRIMLVHLVQLYSPKSTIHRTPSARRNYPTLEVLMGTAAGRARLPPIEIQPLGTAGQSASIPLAQVQILP